MQREKRKDIFLHVRAFSMPQLISPGQTLWAAVLWAANALGKLENSYISCVLPSIRGQNYLPQNGLN